MRGDGRAGDIDGAKNAGNTGAGENAQAEPAESDGSQAGKETAAEADGAGGSGADDVEKTSNNAQGDARTGGDLPETGGMSPAGLLLAGTVLLLMGSTVLSAVARRSSASRG